MDKISNYDKRQLKLMLESMTSFEKNRVDLNSLVGTLEFLLNALEKVDKTWEKNFSMSGVLWKQLTLLRLLKDQEKKRLHQMKTKEKY